MSSEYLLDSSQDAVRKSFPWLAFVLFVGVFFLAYHDLSASTAEFWGRGTLESYGERVVTGNPVRRIVFIVLGLWGLIMLLRLRGNSLRINGVLGGILLLYAIWALLSLIWTNDVALSARRLVVFTLLCVSVLAIAARFSQRDVLLCVFFMTLTYLVLAVLVELANGSFLPWEAQYRLSGTVHPNIQGRNCGLLLISSTVLAHKADRYRYFFVGCAALAFIGIVLTASRTGLVSAAIALLAFWLYVLPGRRKLALIVLVLCSGSALMILFGDVFLSGMRGGLLLGREDAITTYTLTGRIPLWKDLFVYIQDRPFIGYGYGAFWTPRHIAEVSLNQEWAVQVAHSVYVELLLNVGIVGLVCFALALALGVWRAFAYSRATKDSDYAFLGLILIFAAMNGILSSFITNPVLMTFWCMAALSHLGFRPPPITDEERIAHADM